MSTKRRFLSLFLACSMVLSVGQSARAAQTQKSFSDSFEVILGENTFYQEISDEPQTPLGESGQQVSYSYAISDFSEDGEAEATVDFTLEFAGKNVPVSVAGTVSRTIVTADQKNYMLYRGALWGSAAINGKEYKVSLGLDKLSTQEDINAGVVFHPEDMATNEDAELIFLRFGTPIPENILTAYLERAGKPSEIRSTSSAENESAQPLGNAGTMEYVTHKYGNFKANGNIFTGSGTGVGLSVQKDERNNRVCLQLRSYCNALTSAHFPKFIRADISGFTMGLQRVGTDTNFTTFEGVQRLIDVVVTQKKDYKTMFEGVFSLVAAYSPVKNPWAGASALSALCSLLEEATGTVTFDSVGDRPKVTAVVSIHKRLNFDVDNEKMPLYFNIYVPRGTTGTYKATAALTYVIDTLDAGFYVNTSPITTSSFNIYD